MDFNMDASDKKERFVEDVGIFFEKTGQTRMAGRIFALLLVHNDRSISSTELVERLHVSKASVSTMTRFLMNIGIIQKVGIPGDRKDYFRVNPDMLITLIMERFKMTVEFRKLLESSLDFIEDKHPNREKINELVEFYSWLEEELPSLLKRWKKQYKRNKK